MKLIAGFPLNFVLWSPTVTSIQGYKANLLVILVRTSQTLLYTNPSRGYLKDRSSQTRIHATQNTDVNMTYSFYLKLLRYGTLYI